MQFILLMTLFLSVRASLTLVVDGKEDVEHAIPSYDYAITPSFRPFHREGYYVKAKLQRNPETQRCEAVLEYPDQESLSHGKLDAYASSIVLMRWREANKDCKLLSYAQLWGLAQDFMATLPEHGLPPSDTLLIPALKSYRGDIGSPTQESFIGIGVSIPDNPPPKGLNVAFLGGRAWEGTLTMGMRVELDELTKEKHVIGAIVDAEQSRWNQLYGSTWFTVFNWLLASINLVVLGYAMNLFVRNALQQQHIEWNLANVIFLVDALAVALYMAALLTRPFSYAHTMINSVSSTLASIAFHMLMFLWSVFLQRVDNDTRKAYVFRAVLVVSLTINCLSFVQVVMKRNTLPGTVPRRMETVFTWILPAAQLSLACAFALFSLQFYTKIQMVKISPHTVAALTRLSALAIVAFVCYFVLAVINTDVVNRWQIMAARSITMQYVIRLVLTVRALALLAVLGVQIPKHSTSEPKPNISTGSRVSTSSTLVA
jgi:hypothetical protein